MAQDNYEDMTYAELQGAAKERGLPSFGQKAEKLIASLRESDNPSTPEAKPEETKPTEPVVAQYIAMIGRNLKLPMKSSRYKKFEDGSVVHVPGDAVKFQNGFYETSDPEEIAFLDAHPNNKAVGKASPHFVKVEKSLTKSELMKQFEEQSRTLEELQAQLQKEREENLRFKMKETGQEIIDDTKVEGPQSVRGVHGTLTNTPAF